jgi:hypothetical protein
MFRRLRRAARDLFGRSTAAVTEFGQTTAEYALVILGAAAIGTLVLTWATKSHVIGKLFDTVIGKILPG